MHILRLVCASTSSLVAEFLTFSIALYGKSYIAAAKDTWSLIKDRGIDALINDSLVGISQSTSSRLEHDCLLTVVPPQPSSGAPMSPASYAHYSPTSIFDVGSHLLAITACANHALCRHRSCVQQPWAVYGACRTVCLPHWCTML